MASGYSLSAVILSSNSEKKIGKCLESLRGWADEIIVIDGQSTDGTVKIAESYGARVYSHPFLGSFARERNFGTEKCKSEWILQLDSDEFVSADFKKACDEALPETSFAAFKFRRKNIFLGHAFKYGGWYHWSQHLFKKGRAKYEGRVHERMIVDGGIGLLDAEIIHTPFDSISEFIERQNRYTDLQAQDIIDTEKDLSRRNIRYNLKIKPLKLFRKIYFNKKGYMEGFYGLVFALLSSWVHFLKWSKVWELIKDRKNILVIRNDRFGEFLLNIPAMRALKEKFPDSKIMTAVDTDVMDLAKHLPGVDEVLLWERGRHSIFDDIVFAGVLKKKNIDIAFIMNPSKDSNLAVFLAGIEERIGYSHKWDFLLTKKIDDLKHLSQKHEVEYNLDLARIIGADTKNKSVSIDIDASENILNAFGVGNFDHIIAMHPWTSDPVKQWPQERFRELALRLVREPSLCVIIIGGKENFEKSAQYNYLNDRIINLTGKTSLVQLAQLLKNCRLLVSGDSGPVHLASSVGTPVIALFRNDIAGKTPRRWGPWGANGIVIEKRSLQEITVDEVINKINQFKESSDAKTYK